MNRVHSFPQATEIRGIWVFAADFEPRDHRGIRLFPAEFDVFHSNNYFFIENDLKVALLQVCLWWLLFGGDGWMMKLMINEWIIKDS